MKVCTHCKKHNNDKAKFCIGCGEKLTLKNKLSTGFIIFLITAGIGTFLILMGVMISAIRGDLSEDQSIPLTDYEIKLGLQETVQSKLSDDYYSLIKKIDVYNALNNLNQTIPNEYDIVIYYYFDDSVFIDNYLEFLQDATDMFKKTFDADPKINGVGVVSIQAYRDTYGYSQEKYIATAVMERDVYNKINWGGFDSVNLDQIVPIQFQGKSFYKGLKDFQAANERLKDQLEGIKDSYAGGY